MLEAALHHRGHFLRAFDVVALYVNDADGGIDVGRLHDFIDHVDVSESDSGHFDMHFVDFEIEEVREHATCLLAAHCTAFVVAEAHVHTDAGFTDNGLYGAVEDVHKAFGVRLVGVAAHAGLIHADLFAAGSNQVLAFLADHRQKGFGDGVAIGVLSVG